MTQEQKDWSEIIAHDYQAMRDMISQIEIKLMGVDPKTQYSFYRPFRDMIMEAWQDANNPHDSFLFKDTK
jgi:hypothetical protein